MVAKWRSKVLQNAPRGSILQYFWPALRDNWSWKPIFGLFESGGFTLILLYLSSFAVVIGPLMVKGAKIAIYLVYKIGTILIKDERVHVILSPVSGLLLVLRYVTLIHPRFFVVKMSPEYYTCCIYSNVLKITLKR